MKRLRRRRRIAKLRHKVECLRVAYLEACQDRDIARSDHVVAPWQMERYTKIALDAWCESKIALHAALKDVR